ncbi:MAG: alpha/beta hydrolase, partial [Bacteroidota bacterium]
MMRLFTLYLLLCGSAVISMAQESPVGCDTGRYTEDIFTASKTATVQYGENVNALGENQDLFLDVYEPDNDAAEKRPLIIWAFGGSFISGSRELMAPNCLDFAKKGYVAATIDYRLWASENPFTLPDSTVMIDAVIKAVSDMKAAIRFFRQDAATENRFRIDPELIFVGGISAGGITALHTAYLDAEDDIPDFLQVALDNNGGLEGNSGDTDNLSYSSAVSGVVNMSGGLYRTEWMDADEPPLASIHGTADETVPFGFGIVGINILSFRVDLLSINGSDELFVG